MSALLRAESRKVRATPTTWWLLAGTVALSVVSTLAAFAVAARRSEALDSMENLRIAMHTAGAGSILVVCAGIIGMAGEFRFGQADQTFLTSPRRVDVVLAKAAVYGVVGFVFGVTSALATAGSAAIWLTKEGLSLPVGDSVVWLTLVGCVLSATIFGIFGVAIGAIARNQVVAIVTALTWLMVIEPTLLQASRSVTRWFPGATAQALRRAPETGLLAMEVGGAIFALYVVAAAAVGVRRIRRIDVS